MCVIWAAVCGGYTSESISENKNILGALKNVAVYSELLLKQK